MRLSYILKILSISVILGGGIGSYVQAADNASSQTNKSNETFDELMDSLEPENHPDYSNDTVKCPHEAHGVICN